MDRVPAVAPPGYYHANAVFTDCYGQTSTGVLLKCIACGKTFFDATDHDCKPVPGPMSPPRPLRPNEMA